MDLEMPVYTCLLRQEPEAHAPQLPHYPKAQAESSSAEWLLSVVVAKVDPRVSCLIHQKDPQSG